MELWAKHWDSASWREYLTEGGSEDEIQAIRQSTHTGRPLGEEAFVKNLEETMNRILLPQRGGRPVNQTERSAQAQLMFEA